MPKFHFVDRVVMSAETFESLPIVEGKPEAVIAGRVCKAMIERAGRTCWHMVVRQHQFGAPVYFAQPIVVRVYAAEAA